LASTACHLCIAASWVRLAGFSKKKTNIVITLQQRRK
jgi:hypothetical protein